MSSEKPHPDQHYLDGLCRGDSRVIRKIYKTFGEQAKRHVLANSGNLQDAEDVFNKVLIIIYRKACQKGFTLTGAFGGYLMRILKRKWIDELNSRRRSGVTYGMPEGYEYEAIDEPPEKLDEWAREDKKREIFLRCFEQLSESCRKILQTSWEESDMKKVAELLGQTYGGARKSKSKCMSKLRALVKQDSDYDDLINE